MNSKQRYVTIRRKDAFKNNNVLLFKGENKTEQPLNNCKTKTASVAITTTPPTLILTLHTCRKAFFFFFFSLFSQNKHVSTIQFGHMTIMSNHF